MEFLVPSLKEGALLFHGMHAQEELGRLFEYHLDLISERRDIPLEEVLGRNVSVKLELVPDKFRYFNGYITRFAHTGTLGAHFYRYAATVRPWTWFLTRTSDCRIFQNKSTPEIIQDVFADHEGVGKFDFRLIENYAKWVYCVQYRETDFNFISRLMEHEGIYYYFRHEKDHHTIVLTDGKHTAVEGYEKLRFHDPREIAKPDMEYISDWHVGSDMQPNRFVYDDYDMEKPSVDLQTQNIMSYDETGLGALEYVNSKSYELYDYPGTYTEKPRGQQLIDTRMDEYASQFTAAHAVTNSRGVYVGALLTVERLQRENQNTDYLVVAATYDLEFAEYEGMPGDRATRFRSSFVAKPGLAGFRPRRLTPKPFVQGPQTAVVVGPGGEEIYTDKYGRVKVQFHWDRRGKKDDQTSCWIRVGTPWAGKQWGIISIPRIGQEVIVDFLEGDPDQPIIVGCVYNAEQMPPYALPGSKTQSGMKSRSSLGGSPANFNEIRMEDKKGAEQLFIHAEKNQDIEVENDETHWVGHDRKKTIDHDETTHVKHDRTETVDNNETITIHGNRTETVDKNETIKIQAHRSETVASGEDVTVTGLRAHTVKGAQVTSITAAETHKVGAARMHDVGAAEMITVGAAQMIKVGAVQSVDIGGPQNVKIGADQNVEIVGRANLKIGGDQATKVDGDRAADIGKNDGIKVAKNFVLDAGESIDIKTGSASIVMKKDGTISISGKDITITGSGKIKIKADSNVEVKGSKVAIN